MYGQRFRETIKALDPKKEFLLWSGGIPFADLHAEYRNADAFVFASSCENLPNILIEAMSAGLPIACSKSGPMPEILDNAGVYFDPEQAQDISKAMQLLLESDELRKQLSSRSKELSHNYSWALSAKHTFEFISKVQKKYIENINIG
jgi:glycosyltransferase involved in cell wall biosynthesis